MEGLCLKTAECSAESIAEVHLSTTVLTPVSVSNQSVLENKSGMQMLGRTDCSKHPQNNLAKTAAGCFYYIKHFSPCCLVSGLSTWSRVMGMSVTSFDI